LEKLSNPCITILAILGSHGLPKKAPNLRHVSAKVEKNYGFDERISTHQTIFSALPGLGAKREKTAASIACIQRLGSGDNLLLRNWLSLITQGDIGIFCT
jgi:hypothetical protein